MRVRTIKMWAVVTVTGRIVGNVSRSKQEARWSAAETTGYTCPSERELKANGYKTVQVIVTGELL